MAVTFLEPGGDADFQVATGNGFWSYIYGSPTAATDFIHGNHKKSIKYSPNSTDWVESPNSSLSDSGSRISFYLYINAFPANSTPIFLINGNGDLVIELKLDSSGILILYGGGSQAGSDSTTLNIGVWYRISIAYTIASTSVNSFRVFKNSNLVISANDISLYTNGSTNFELGNLAGDLTLDIRTSDHYIDNSTSLTDTGDIWVAAKRPVANGTTNGFTTQIGSGGSGYGSGHSPQVNERPLSTTNGWSMVGAGSAVTEEYNVENSATGDINLNGITIVDWLGWASMSSLVGETVQIILDGANNSQAITSTTTLYTKIKGSSIYPSGTGADIGITTDTSLTTVSLFECGIVVAYIPVPRRRNFPLWI